MICGLTRPGSVVSWCIHGRDRIGTGTGRDRYGSHPHGDGDRRAVGRATTYSSRLDLSGALAVALSQSGQTEEIVETLAHARDCGARTLAITNGAGSALAEAAEGAVLTEAGGGRGG